MNIDQVLRNELTPQQYAAAVAAYAAERTRQVQDMRDVIAKRARKDGEG